MAPLSPAMRDPSTNIHVKSQGIGIPVVQFLLFHPGHTAVRVVEIAEDDGLGGTRLLARGHNVAIANLPAFPFGIDLRFVDALHAVGALFHHAAAAHADVGVAAQLEAGSLPVLVQQEIEAPHFVRTVIGAVAGAHAAVVDHVVEAFARVVGGLYRADQLAGRILTVHARDRLIVDLGLADTAAVISIDAQPLHLTAAAPLVRE